MTEGSSRGILWWYQESLREKEGDKGYRGQHVRLWGLLKESEHNVGNNLYAVCAGREVNRMSMWVWWSCMQSLLGNECRCTWDGLRVCDGGKKMENGEQEMRVLLFFLLRERIHHDTNVWIYSEPFPSRTSFVTTRKETNKICSLFSLSVRSEQFDWR